jgi:NADH dehydrogenase
MKAPRAEPVDIVSQQPESRPRVVIVGAGFAGLHAAKGLSTDDILVTVIDRHNHHLFQPLLYQVATAALSPGDISYPIRAVLKKHKASRTVLADVLDIDVAAKQVLLADGVLPYDYLILAAGSQTSHDGRPPVDVYGHPVELLRGQFRQMQHGDSDAPAIVQ